ncbi:MAG: hypothetical protein JKY96_04525 [Phycisphaerales bacterium]|nr:hypothetical protein [Phycisphaerales bacterium]
MLWNKSKKVEVGTTVSVKTGKFVRGNLYSFSNKTALVVNEKPFSDRTGHYYHDHKIEVPLATAVQYLIDHFGIRAKYQISKDEVEGALYIPTQEVKAVAKKPVRKVVKKRTG